MDQTDRTKIESIPFEGANTFRAYSFRMTEGISAVPLKPKSDLSLRNYLGILLVIDELKVIVEPLYGA